MTSQVDHIRGHTFHGRKGDVKNAFRYGVDYILLDAEDDIAGPALFARNRGNLTSLQDCDHGGAPSGGAGAKWVRDVLCAHQLNAPARIRLLAQPRVMGHVFNPVSFWLCENEHGDMTAVIAEVTNTYGDRHSYLCHHPDQSPIGPSDRLSATKIMYVSPFQPVAGSYSFRFDIGPDRIGIWIDYSQGKGGLVATLTGPRAPLSNLGILGMMLRRPFGSRRVLALIHWQALKLWWKGVTFRSPPKAPAQDVSSG